MQLNLLSLSSGKMYPESCLQRITPSGVSWADLLGVMGHWSLQGQGDGQTLVMCLDPDAQSRGGCWTPNISAWPNAAAVSTLSRVLETGSIPQKYFLSSTACAGILRRAAKRGRTLPEPLRRALEEVAGREQAQVPA